MALSLAFKIFLGGALFGALTLLLPFDSADLSVFMLTRQDTVVLALGAALLFTLTRHKPPFTMPVWKGREHLVPWVAAVFAAVTGYAGAYLAALHFPLSMDEFMAVFDARIVLGGHLAAPLPAEWQDTARALQPIFAQTDTAGNWVSTYLPGNAILHAMFMRLGDYALTAPILAAISIFALYGIARIIWPQRREAAVIAVILLATSSQFLITAMTPYAMTAHLAFNLVWLWLFLRNAPASHAAALAAGFAATGLHQLVFHPLFAAPFVLGLWIGRRFALASVYTLGYAAICLFWASYWGLVLEPAAEAPAALTAFALRAMDMFSVDAGTFAFMIRNLFRFIAWQNPATLVLFVLAIISARRWASPLPQLMMGIVLTTLAMAVILPYQGHGWGYRYLHGLLGNVSLIAAAGWLAMTRKEGAHLRSAIGACTIFALAMVPLRGWQVHAFTEPYAAADRAIRGSGADVVIVDPTGIWFGADLIRNDPYLREGPKVLALNLLDEASIQKLCASGPVLLFDSGDATHFGIRQIPAEPVAHNTALREIMSGLGCGERLTGAGT